MISLGYEVPQMLSRNATFWFLNTSMLCSNTAEVRLALRNLTKSVKLVTEEACWECFFFFFFSFDGKKFEPQGVYFSPWHHDNICVELHGGKRPQTVTHRRSFSLRWITKIISSSVVMEQINQSKMWPVSHIYRRSVAHCMRRLSLRHQLRSSASCLLSDCLQKSYRSFQWDAALRSTKQEKLPIVITATHLFEL